MKNIKNYNDFVNETTMTLSSHEKVEVPEKDITEVIDAVQNWFDKNPDKQICRPSIFGYYTWDIHRDSIEKDVRECAKQAKPYSKA